MNTERCIRTMYLIEPQYQDVQMRVKSPAAIIGIYVSFNSLKRSPAYAIDYY